MDNNGIKDNYNTRRKRALFFFASALACEEYRFELNFLDEETVEVYDIKTNARKNVNIAADNIPVMLYDILRQAGDWIM